MTIGTTVVFHGVARSDALDRSLREQADHLHRFATDLRTCRVTVSRAAGRRHQGTPYEVSIHVAVDGQQFDVVEVRADEPYAAASSAFASMKRIVEEFVRRRRGDVKRHEQATG